MCEDVSKNLDDRLPVETSIFSQSAECAATGMKSRPSNLPRILLKDKSGQFTHALDLALFVRSLASKSLDPQIASLDFHLRFGQPMQLKSDFSLHFPAGGIVVDEHAHHAAVE